MIAAAATKSIASRRADGFLASALSTFETHSKVRFAKETDIRSPGSASDGLHAVIGEIALLLRSRLGQVAPVLPPTNMLSVARSVGLKFHFICLADEELASKSVFRQATVARYCTVAD
jgi:hypothetical protein